jgi:hypothetical protein
MRPFVLAALVAVLLLAASSSATSADVEWCEDDPTVLVPLPGGSMLVHVTDYALGREHLAALRAATITSQVLPDGTGQVAPAGPAAADVVLDISIPDDAYASGFPTRSIVSTLPHAAGTVLAAASGQSGQVMRLTFTVVLPADPAWRA